MQDLAIDMRSTQNIRYYITYSWNSGTRSTFVIVSAPSEDGEVSYTINSLRRGTNYTIQVRISGIDYYYCSGYDNIHGPYSDPVSFQTNTTGGYILL